MYAWVYDHLCIFARVFVRSCIFAQVFVHFMHLCTGLWTWVRTYEDVEVTERTRLTGDGGLHAIALLLVQRH